MNRLRLASWAVSGMFLTAPVMADNLWSDIFHGLDLAVTPSGSPVTTLNNGFRVNGARQGRVRVVPNRLGDGYRLELDRSFGVDDSGRPEIFDAGPYELELSGGIQSTLGFTRRNFFGNDHSHNSFFIGNGEVGISNLNYSIRETSGVQDVTLSGTLNGAGSLQLNQLGFYTLSMDVSNTNSQLLLDGMVVEGTEDTDFDIGPINVKGNLFFDIAVSALSSVGVDTTRLEQIFPNSGIDRITQNIQQSLAEQVGTLGEDAAAKAAAGASLSNSPLQPLLQELDIAAQREAVGPMAVPEPASLVLLVLGGGVFARSIRRS